MADLTPRNLQQIRARDPQLGDCLADITQAHNNVAQQTNASPVGITPAPGQHAALNVVAGAGCFSAKITDNDPSFRGKEHFLEVSEDQAFTAPHVIHLGASQSWYGYLGSKTLHFRSFAQYPTSAPGAPVYAYAVDGSKGNAPSVQGNGTAAGWGTQPYSTPTVPIR